MAPALLVLGMVEPRRWRKLGRRRERQRARQVGWRFWVRRAQKVGWRRSSSQNYSSHLPPSAKLTLVLVGARRNAISVRGGASGDYQLNFVERDQWYLLVDCKKCRRSTVLCEVATSEEFAAPMRAAFSWKCPHCGAKRRYQPEDVQRCQGIYL